MTKRQFKTRDGKTVEFVAKEGGLSPERQARLDALFVMWAESDRKWAERVARGEHIIKGKPRA